MDFKGTPGPWHLMAGTFSKHKDSNAIQVYATNDDLEMVCKVHKDWLIHRESQDFEANAKLIAAAPELLDALQDSVMRLEYALGNGNITTNTKECWRSVEIGKEAIKKALK